MTNPWSRKVKRKPSLKGLAKTNGTTKAKPTLRALVTTAPAPIERPYQEPKPRVKEDFRIAGVLFSGAEITGEVYTGHRQGMFRPVGSVDVTNGDQTYTLHNRNGSWMHDVYGGNTMAEPALVATWLGIDMSQIEMARALSRRFEAELKKQGVLTVTQQRARLEAEAAEARKRKAVKPAPKPVAKRKPSLKALGSRT